MEIVRIKEAKEPLLSKIIELEEQAFEGNGNVDLWIIKALIRYGLVYILVEENEVISIVEYMRYFDENSVFLYGISTIKNKRHKGYATKIMKYTEDVLKKTGIEKISLTVDPKNNIAIEMYKKFGYETVEFQKDEYGEGIDRYLMIKKI